MSHPQIDPAGFHMELAQQSLAAWIEGMKDEFIEKTLKDMQSNGLVVDSTLESSLRNLIERYQDQSTWRLVSYVEYLHRKGVDFTPAFRPSSPRAN